MLFATVYDDHLNDSIESTTAAEFNPVRSQTTTASLDCSLRNVSNTLSTRLAGAWRRETSKELLQKEVVNSSWVHCSAACTLNILSQFSILSILSTHFGEHLRFICRCIRILFSSSYRTRSKGEKLNVCKDHRNKHRSKRRNKHFAKKGGFRRSESKNLVLQMFSSDTSL